MVGKPPVSREHALPVREQRDKVGETGRAGAFTSRWSPLQMQGWWWWYPTCPTVYRPLQQVHTFSKPSYPSSDLDSPCNLKSRSRYSAAGVPECLPTDPLTESCEQLCFPLGVVLNVPPLWLLLPLHWLCGLESRWQWSSCVNSVAWNTGLLKPGALPGAPRVGFRQESRYLKA